MVPNGESKRWSRVRRAMVEEQLQARGIQNAQVLRVMGELPREQFVPADVRDAAYDDRAVPVGENQTISQPYMVAYMTQTLALEPMHRVLEIGTGTGYQTAILCAIAAEVYSVERLQSLHDSARKRLQQLGITRARLFCGDGSLGWPEHAPYDRILVTAGAPEVPDALLDQLVDRGLLVVPVGEASEQVLLRVEKRQGRTVETPLLACRFVPLVGRKGWG